MRPYTETAMALKTMIDEGKLKPGKSVSLKQTALAANVNPGRAAEAFRGWHGDYFLRGELAEVGIDDVVVEVIGSGRYRRTVFKRLKP